jgi:hypothetical protein
VTYWIASVNAPRTLGSRDRSCIRRLAPCNPRPPNSSSSWKLPPATHALVHGRPLTSSPMRKVARARPLTLRPEPLPPPAAWLVHRQQACVRAPLATHRPRPNRSRCYHTMHVSSQTAIFSTKPSYSLLPHARVKTRSTGHHRICWWHALRSEDFGGKLGGRRSRRSTGLAELLNSSILAKYSRGSSLTCRHANAAIDHLINKHRIL